LNYRPNYFTKGKFGGLGPQGSGPDLGMVHGEPSRRWRMACQCAALPELWFTGPRRKGIGARGLHGELVLVVTRRREAMELAGIEGWWWRLLELVAVSTGVGWRGFGSGDWRGVEWLCSRGLYIGWSRGEKVVAVSMAGGCFFITLNVAVSRRGSDRVGIGCGRG
jgi:hypothetical protein